METYPGHEGSKRRVMLAGFKRHGWFQGLVEGIGLVTRVEKLLSINSQIAE